MMADDDATRCAIDVMTAWAQNGDLNFLHQRIDARPARPGGRVARFS
jgi:hypothetical protein